MTPAGVVTTLAGSAEGFADGSGATARFRRPTGIALDAVGNIYVADSLNHRIRKVSPAGEVTTLAGGDQGATDGIGAVAQFNLPTGIAVDGDGNVVVADTYNHRIRKVSPTGEVSTLAGSVTGYADGIGADARSRPSASRTGWSSSAT